MRDQRYITYKEMPYIVAVAAAVLIPRYGMDLFKAEVLPPLPVFSTMIMTSFIWMDFLADYLWPQDEYFLLKDRLILGVQGACVLGAFFHKNRNLLSVRLFLNTMWVAGSIRGIIYRDNTLFFATNEVLDDAFRSPAPPVHHNIRIIAGAPIPVVPPVLLPIAEAALCGNPMVSE